MAAGAKDGIVFAADSLQTLENGAPPIEDGQKIWEAKSLHRDSIMCGCYGACEIIPLRGPKFSFREYSEFALSTLNLDCYRGNPGKFLSAFGEKMRVELQRYLLGQNRNDPVILLDYFIADIPLAWFSDGKPCAGCVCFVQDNGLVSYSTLFYGSGISDLVVRIGGSETILSRGLRSISNLDGAIQVAAKFAQDCIDYRLILADCSQFGGKVHVGVLRESGFSWDTEPCPKTLK